MVNSLTIIGNGTSATKDSVGIKGGLVRNTTDLERVSWISPNNTLVIS